MAGVTQARQMEDEMETTQTNREQGQSTGTRDVTHDPPPRPG